jgi:hypothetical protein
MPDDFDTDPGIKDNYVGTIIDASFQPGERGTSLQLRTLAEDGAEVVSFYSIGADWQSYDGGETIEHATKEKVRADSQLATLVDRAMKCGAEKEIRARSDANGKLAQKTSKLWPGLTFHWIVVGKPYDFKDRETGEQVTGTTLRQYPDEFIGVGDIPATNSDTTTEAAPKPPDEILAMLTENANSMSYQEWLDAGLQNDWVRSNMLSALSDEGYYNSLKG